MKRFGAYRALVLFVARVCELVVLVVAFLMKTLATMLAHPRLIILMNSHVCIQRRAAIERFAAKFAHVWLITRVNDLVATEC